jgi:hypothetical protein
MGSFLHPHVYKTGGGSTVVVLMRRSHRFLCLFLLLEAMHVCTAGSSSRSSSPVPLDVVAFYKDIYASLTTVSGLDPAAEVALQYQLEFEALDTDGTLASNLSHLIELHLLDLQVSLRHAEHMQAVLQYWEGASVSPSQ